MNTQRDGRPNLSAVVFVPPTDVEVLVMRGDGGAGKTRIIKRSLAELRARGKLAKATASANLPATLILNASSLHALLGLPIDVTDAAGNVVIDVKPRGTVSRS